MDKLQLFDRSSGISPFLLLDGHGSRFEIPFLEYILKPDHPWKVCIGVPYGTLLWQVGDSTEQNGCFKMSLTEEKRKLVENKETNGIQGTIEKTDIVGLVTHAWTKSFNRVQTNHKAIAERGWGPMNYNILLHPEVSRKMRKKHYSRHNNQSRIRLLSILTERLLEMVKMPRKFFGRGRKLP
jgi:hypothetical protein